MPTREEIEAALAALPTIEAVLRDALEAGPAVVSGVASSDVTVTSTANGTVTIAPSGEWPASGSWAEKEAWIVAGAGVKAATLPVAGIDGTPPGCTWITSTKTLNVAGTVALIDGWEVPGRIYVKDHAGVPLTLRNVRAGDVFNEKLSGQPAAARVELVEDCEFVESAENVIAGWGQGTLNAMRPGFIVRRTVMRGAADGMQCSGGGTIEDSVVRDLTIAGVAPAGTHNDFVQNYGGAVTIRRTVMRQDLVAGQESHLNGVFCSEAGATFDIADSSVVVTAPAGMNAFCLHAGKTGIAGIRIDVRDSYVRGRKVGNVVFGPGVDWAAGY